MTAGEVQESRNWKVKKGDGSRLEPANLEVLRQWVQSGQIGPDDLVINDELAHWIPASEVLDLFDLFDKKPPEADAPKSAPVKEPPQPPEEKPEEKVRVPDCAFHAGREATEICIGCGKFICEECREVVDKKAYCRRCSAEKTVGAEPGAPVGSGAVAQIIPGAVPVVPMNKFAVIGLVFSAIALVASCAIVPFGFSVMIMAAPAVGFLAFTAALLSGLALNQIRQSDGALRGRSYARAGFALGCVVLAFSLTFVGIFATGGRPVGDKEAGLEATGSGRRSGLRLFSRRQSPAGFGNMATQEAEAAKLLEQAREYLEQGQLEPAVSTCKTIIRYYPGTEAAKIAEERLPVLEEALAGQQANAEAIRLQNEEAARGRFDHAMEMLAGGDRATGLDLLKSIVDSYPETEVAAKAKTEAARVESEIVQETMRRHDGEAARIAAQAGTLMDSERYEEALALYRRIESDYSDTPTATSIMPRMQEATVLAGDPSEREFRRIEKDVDSKTYEKAIDLLRAFLREYPDSERAEEAEQLLNENQRNKNAADSLYTFGHAYFVDEKYNNALRQFRTLIDDYPRSRWVSQAEKEYDETLRKMEE
jgi:tetratricopeptide (TPR) repeat protein